MKTLLSILLTALLSEIGSFEADFVQMKTSSLFAEPEQSTGHLTYRQPDYLRWEYISPQPFVWEVNGSKDNVNPQVRQIVMLILKSINGSYLAPNNDFNVDWESGEVAVLTPKRREIKQLFDHITIRLNTKSGIADEVMLYEQSGDETQIRFLNVIK